MWRTVQDGKDTIVKEFMALASNRSHPYHLNKINFTRLHSSFAAIPRNRCCFLRCNLFSISLDIIPLLHSFSSKTFSQPTNPLHTFPSNNFPGPGMTSLHKSVLWVSPELWVMVHVAEPFLRQPAAVETIWKPSPLETAVTLHPDLIWNFPSEGKGETRKIQGKSKPTSEKKKTNSRGQVF